MLSMIAKHVAEAAPVKKTVLIDSFGGAGGNAIAFARSGRWEQIFVIEKDRATLNCAKKNAEIYGVAKKIYWIHGDCFQILSERFTGLGDKAVIFASPPWGGRLALHDSSGETDAFRSNLHHGEDFRP